MLAAACSNDSGVTIGEKVDPTQPLGEDTPTETEAGDGPAEGIDPTGADAEPFIPAGPVGSAEAWDELVAGLSEALDAEQLAARPPWPDTRNPDPVVAQAQIYDLWVWMYENTAPVDLIDILSAPGSPTRGELRILFTERTALDIRNSASTPPYSTHDQIAVTAATSGLPETFLADLPADSVVVFYFDSQGPYDIISNQTDEVIDSFSGKRDVGPWLSVLVPTDVGWLLHLDVLLADVDPGYELPQFNEEPPPPNPGINV